MFGRKLDEPDQSMSLPTTQVVKPGDMSGFLVAKTLIPSDNIARDVRVVGEMPWPSRPRGNPVSSDPDYVASLEAQIKALEKQGE